MFDMLCIHAVCTCCVYKFDKAIGDIAVNVWHVVYTSVASYRWHSSECLTCCVYKFDKAIGDKAVNVWHVVYTSLTKLSVTKQWMFDMLCIQVWQSYRWHSTECLTCCVYMLCIQVWQSYRCNSSECLTCCVYMLCVHVVYTSLTKLSVT